MAGESARDLRKLAAEELKSRERELREELFNLRFQKETGEIGDTSRMKNAKKELARVMTVLKEKSDVSSG